jgi:ArsR family transcriptional regulator
MKEGPSPFARLGTLADPVRGRLLFLLDRHELTVSELTTALRLPQSTVSRHLRVLGDDGWVVARADGTSHLYRLAGGQLEPGARRLWHLVREQMAGTMAVAADAQRLSGILAERRTRSQDFFTRAAGQSTPPPAWANIPKYVGWWINGPRYSVLSKREGKYTRAALGLEPDEA